MERRPIGIMSLDSLNSAQSAATESERYSPDYLYASVLAACHLEWSALSFLSLPVFPEGITSTGLASTVFPTMGKSDRDDLSNTFRNYARDTLIDLGIIRKDKRKKSNGTVIDAYSVTALGEAAQAVGYLLLTAIEHLNQEYLGEVALPDIFCQSIYDKNGRQDKISDPTRLTPFARASILTQLHTLPEGVTESVDELHYATSTPFSTTIKHLDALQAAQLITYRSTNSERTREFQYQKNPQVDFPENIVFVHHKIGRLAEQFITDNIRKRVELGLSISSRGLVSETYDVYCAQRVQQGLTVPSRTTFQAYVGAELVELAAQGILSADFLPRKTHSHVALTSLGRAVADVLEHVRSVCEDPQVFEQIRITYQRNREQFVQVYGDYLLDRHKRSGKQQKTKEIRLKKAIGCLLEEGGKGIRAEQFSSKVEISMGHYLVAMVRDGVVFRVKGDPEEGVSAKASTYFLTESAKKNVTEFPEISYEKLVATLRAGQISEVSESSLP